MKATDQTKQHKRTCPDCINGKFCPTRMILRAAEREGA